MYEYKVRDVLRVVDGDTVDARISLGFGQTATLRFRLTGVDAPEVYGPQASEEGKRIRDLVEDWLMARAGRLKVETYKGSAATVGLGDGAFGRWLADFIDLETEERLSAVVEGKEVVSG
jgi:endonuclease YncB( thermonuclease family)